MGTERIAPLTDEKLELLRRLPREFVASEVGDDLAALADAGLAQFIGADTNPTTVYYARTPAADILLATIDRQRKQAEARGQEDERARVLAQRMFRDFREGDPICDGGPERPMTRQDARVANEIRRLTLAEIDEIVEAQEGYWVGELWDETPCDPADTFTDALLSVTRATDQTPQEDK